MTMSRKALGGIIVAATIAASATPAEAQRYRRHHHHHNNSGAVIGAGIIGLGIGAAIASSGRNGYGGYYRYGRGYDPYYYDSYYGRGYYGNGYYNRGYYGDRYRYRCVTRRVWDPYWRRYVRVRYC